MTDEPKLEQQRVTMERHIQTALVILITAVLGWIAFSVTETLKSTTRLEVKVETLESQLHSVQNALRGAPTAAEWRALLDRFDDHEQRLRQIESRMDRRPFIPQ